MTRVLSQIMLSAFDIRTIDCRRVQFYDIYVEILPPTNCLAHTNAISPGCAHWMKCKSGRRSCHSETIRAKLIKSGACLSIHLPVCLRFD